MTKFDRHWVRCAKLSFWKREDERENHVEICTYSMWYKWCERCRRSRANEKKWLTCTGLEDAVSTKSSIGGSDEMTYMRLVCCKVFAQKKICCKVFARKKRFARFRKMRCCYLCNFLPVVSETRGNHHHSHARVAIILRWSPFFRKNAEQNKSTFLLLTVRTFFPTGASEIWQIKILKNIIMIFKQCVLEIIWKPVR